MSTFLHYVHCKDALLDCSAPGGERCESLTWVDEITVLLWCQTRKLTKKPRFPIQPLKYESRCQDTFKEMYSRVFINHFDQPTVSWDLIFHYCDVIMGTMASQITILTIVYSIVHSGADQRKHQSSASLVLVSGTGEFSAQMASNAENVSIWWRHHVYSYGPIHIDIIFSG